MKNFLESNAEAVSPLLRIVAGLLFAFHGLQKLTGVLEGFQPPVGSQLWFGGIIELTTGVAMALGAYMPFAALLASGTMAVAYVQFHWKLDLGAQFFPAINKGEPALLNAFLFLYFACRGAGRWSVDAARQK
jgi:putative oxidoreductase